MNFFDKFIKFAHLVCLLLNNVQNIVHTKYIKRKICNSICVCVCVDAKMHRSEFNSFPLVSFAFFVFNEFR